MRRSVLLLCAIAWLAGCGPARPAVPTPDVSVVLTAAPGATPAAAMTAWRVPAFFPTPAPRAGGPLSPAPLPSPSADQVRTAGGAAAYSLDLLRAQGLESSPRFDADLFSPVSFPDGSPGSFVALGFAEPSRGYQLLYRLRGESAELVGAVRPGPYVWGRYSLRPGSGRGQGEAGALLQLVDLFGTAAGAPVVLRITGAGQARNERWEDGVFELVAVTDSGLQTLFQGVERDSTFGTFEYHYWYTFQDLDGDGVQEVIWDGLECETRYDVTSGVAVKVACTAVHEVYRFDGRQYVKAPG